MVDGITPRGDTGRSGCKEGYKVPGMARLYTQPADPNIRGPWITITCKRPAAAALTSTPTHHVEALSRLLPEALGLVQRGNEAADVDALRE